MTVRERLLALRLYEKQKRNPWLAKKLGINVQVNREDDFREKNKK